MLTSPGASQLNFMPSSGSQIDSDPTARVELDVLQSKVDSLTREKELLEVQLAEAQHDVKDAWKQFELQNAHKVRIMERNDELKIEISQFKSHFKQYDTQSDKQKKESGEYFNDILILKEEIEQLMWKNNTLRINLQEERLKTSTLSKQVKTLTSDLQSQQEERQTLEANNIRL